MGLGKLVVDGDGALVIEQHPVVGGQGFRLFAEAILTRLCPIEVAL